MPTETPYGQQAITYHAREERRMLSRLPIQSGVIGAGSLKVTPVSALTVAVAAGDAWLAGSHAGVTRQGMYPFALAASENVTLGTANATNPRIDQVVLRLRDTAPAPGVAGDAENSGKIEVVAGTATAGATLDNRTGAAALPASALRLADILVPATFTGPFVAGTHIRDRRPWAFGARYTASLGSAGASATASPGVAIDSANGKRRLELSGAPLVARLVSTTRNSTATADAVIGFMYDGALFAQRSATSAIANPNQPMTVEVVIPAPTAGSHLVDWNYWPQSGGSASLPAASTVIVYEDLQYSADNGTV